MCIVFFPQHTRKLYTGLSKDLTRRQHLKQHRTQRDCSKFSDRLNYGIHPREKNKIKGNENTITATVGAPVKTKLRVLTSGTGVLSFK